MECGINERFWKNFERYEMTNAFVQFSKLCEKKKCSFWIFYFYFSVFNKINIWSLPFSENLVCQISFMLFILFLFFKE